MFKYVIRLREFQVETANWYVPILNELTDVEGIPDTYKFTSIPAFLINLNEDQKQHIENKYGMLVEVRVNR